MKINDNFINLFMYLDTNNKLKDVNVFYGQKWSEVLKGHEELASIFNAVDNGNGVVDPNELNILTKLMLHINKENKDDKNNIRFTIDDFIKFSKKIASGDVKLEDLANDKNSQLNWSEGLNRNIDTIKLLREDIPSLDLEIIKEEMRQIGEEQGFSVEELDGGINHWLEDVAIRKHDGEMYVPYHSSPENSVSYNKKDYQLKTEKGHINSIGQGNVLERGNAFDLDVGNNVKFYGTSYLEGGNVINTKLASGEAGAIVGESSIGFSLLALGLEKTPENIEKVKDIIAKDLDLKLENVTFIPQYDFHIDMLYHHFQDGRVAVPNFEEGIRLIEDNPELIKDPKERITRLKKLVELRDKTKGIREEVEAKLVAGGYKLVRIPNFTVNSKDDVNFMNGITGTSKKTGDTFYITNKAKDSALEEAIEPYFKQLGIDKVYFVSTQNYLKLQGGIDCLTQEE